MFDICKTNVRAIWLDDEAVRLAVIKRLPWIMRRRREFQSARRQSECEMVTGESHYVWGRRKRLQVVERSGRTHLEIAGERLLLYTSAATTADERRAALDRWYREQLRDALPRAVEAWEQRLGLSVPKWTVRRMKIR